MNLSYITHPACALHEQQPGHPESPARLAAVESALEESGLLQAARRHTAPPATREQLLRVHTAAHIERIHAMAPQSGLVSVDPDTSMNPFSLAAALHAAGAVTLAASLAASGSARRVFCNVRPPGHHAERARSMGFCLFNSIAAGIGEALEVHGLERIAVIDFDVHHGNGTEDIFADESRVMMCSTYQYPLYPFRKARLDDERMINVALSPGTGGDALRVAAQTRWLPALERFCPQMLFVSAGFDAHEQDPLAGLAWTDADFAWLGSWLGDFADRHCGGRVIAALEGGYALAATAGSSAAFLAALQG